MTVNQSSPSSFHKDMKSIHPALTDENFKAISHGLGLGSLNAVAGEPKIKKLVPRNQNAPLTNIKSKVSQKSTPSVRKEGGFQVQNVGVGVPSGNGATAAAIQRTVPIMQPKSIRHPKQSKKPAKAIQTIVRGVFSHVADLLAVTTMIALTLAALVGVSMLSGEGISLFPLLKSKIIHTQPWLLVGVIYGAYVVYALVFYLFTGGTFGTKLTRRK